MRLILPILLYLSGCELTPTLMEACQKACAPRLVRSVTGEKCECDGRQPPEGACK